MNLDLGMPAMAALPAIQMGGATISLAAFLSIMAAMFVLELAFFVVPGISFTSLLIATASMYVGFVPTFVVCLVAINAAHFIWRKDVTLFMPNAITLLAMIGYASFFGPDIISAVGWGVFGLGMGLVKWGTALPLGFVFGKNVPKRVMNIVLEPPFNFFIFWKLNFLFMFLF